MAANPQHQRMRLSIEVEPELRRQIETAAADREISVHDYILSILRRAVTEDENGEAIGWARLSAQSFARDWESDADQVL